VRVLEKLQFHAGSCEIDASRAAADARGVSLLTKREQEVVECVVEGLFHRSIYLQHGRRKDLLLYVGAPAKIVVSKYSF
jgi:FixJ family two-component response regulator